MHPDLSPRRVGETQTWARGEVLAKGWGQVPGENNGTGRVTGTWPDPGLLGRAGWALEAAGTPRITARVIPASIHRLSYYNLLFGEYGLTWWGCSGGGACLGKEVWTPLACPEAASVAIP